MYLTFIILLHFLTTCILCLKNNQLMVLLTNNGYEGQRPREPLIIP